LPELNVNIPVFTCLVRNEFPYNFTKGQGEFTESACFGNSSAPGRALGVHVLLPNVAFYGRLPSLALVHSEKLSQDIKDVSELQLWDCPSEHISYIEYDLLKESRCHVLLPSGQQNGKYMFTLDWFGNTYSESAGELGWKSCHVVKLDNGYFAAQPNNRIVWEIPAWTKVDKKPDYLITEKTYKCELGKVNIEDAKFFY